MNVSGCKHVHLDCKRVGQDPFMECRTSCNSVKCMCCEQEHKFNFKTTFSILQFYLQHSIALTFSSNIGIVFGAFVLSNVFILAGFARAPIGGAKILWKNL